MPNPLNPNCIPLSLYIHIPWCVKKCPYCDFNSHNRRDEPPFEAYIDALLEDYRQLAPTRPLHSIFMGGGTPSLMSGKQIHRLLQGIAKYSSLPDEITMEVNPGTVERDSFKHYREAGITRISLGVQSFHDEMLKKIGRIHDGHAAASAISEIKQYFDNWNLDLMYGLPQQTLAQAMQDLQMALSFDPPHLSWYQLTLEPNTLFYHQKPAVPGEEVIYDMFIQGHELLKSENLIPYEVSAFTKDRPCQHNLNYWQFGDYLGIGAGAHSKVTTESGMTRTQRYRNPNDYLSKRPFAISQQVIHTQDLPFEFMLNALRLSDGFATTLYQKTTGQSLAQIKPTLDLAVAKGLLEWEDNWIRPTKLGKLYLNDLMALFLEHEHTNTLPN